MVGVFSKQWVEPLAHVLNNLGAERAFVVHGSDGLDEITTSGPTSVASLENGKVTTFEISPEDVGLRKVKPEALRGGDAATNADALKAVLSGEDGAYREVVLMNAAAALVVAGRAEDMHGGVALAKRSIDSGAADAALGKLVAASNA
jgi:anthranilate phosphoribosyltransferase